jgi:tRNA(Ile)-lysidine synthase
MGPHPAVAAVRLAVRRALAAYPVTMGVRVACSGGADSVALAAATAFECLRTGRPAAFATVDHGLQDGSDEQARRVADLGYELGFDPVELIRVVVGVAGGPEAAARDARYAALLGSPDLLLLGHTADDQAETVLLGLGRGSGPRSIAGMRQDRDGLLRPFLRLRRRDTAAACLALGLPVWDDPHNRDSRFRRVRLRTEVIPLLEDVLAGGVTAALARTAEQLQDDLDALDQLATAVLAQASSGPGADRAKSGAAEAQTETLEIGPLQGQPRAVLRRVLKSWVERAGSGQLAASHVAELDRLVTDWRGQGPIDLPSGIRVARSSGRLVLIPPRQANPSHPQ